MFDKEDKQETSLKLGGKGNHPDVVAWLILGL
jgi:hypothetical protein